jgi:hypothetical protein
MPTVTEINKGDVIAMHGHNYLVHKVTHRKDFFGKCIDWDLRDLCHLKAKWMSIGDDDFDFQITLVTKGDTK